MDNYTPNPFITQPIYDPTRPFATPSCGKSRVNTFKELEEKIHNCVLGWKEKFISKAGREILIKTVAQAIPTYAMSLFKLPKSMCDSINSLLANIGGDKIKRNERSIGLIGKNYAQARKKGGWDLEICTHSTWLCSQSKHGD